MSTEDKNTDKVGNDTIHSVRRSFCCNANIYEVPVFYTTNMLDNNGQPIKMVTVCSKCGKETTKFYID